MNNTVVQQLIISLLLGAFIGLERQIHEKNEHADGLGSFLGLRTFALVTPLGTLAGIIYPHIPALFFLTSIAFILLVIAYYAFDSYYSKDIGITTEIALIYSYVIGVLIATNILPLYLVTSLTIILGLILSRKESIKILVSKIENEQMKSFISYLVIALVVLPLLPNVSYTLEKLPQLVVFFSSFGIDVSGFAAIEIVNPYKLWLVVALIAGIDVFGYIMEKTVGQQKGWLLTSFAGGFISSTATTGSLSLQSKTASSVDHLVAAAVVANLASFVQEAIIILPISFLLFTKLAPALAIMILSSIFLSVYFLKKNTLNANLVGTKEQLKKTTLFHLTPALKFALLFVFVRLFAQVALKIFGESGFFFSIGLGAIPGIDAVLLSIAELTGKTITINNALWAFLLANTVNLCMKAFYSFTNGKKEFAVKFSVSVAVILISSAVGILLVS